MKTRLLILVLAVVFLAGCPPANPKLEVAVAQQTFIGIAKVMTQLKAQGQLGDDEIKDVSAMLHLGEKYLAEWEAAVVAGKDNPAVVAAFTTILDDLIKIRRNHDNGTNTGPASTDN